MVPTWGLDGLLVLSALTLLRPVPTMVALLVEEAAEDGVVAVEVAVALAVAAVVAEVVVVEAASVVEEASVAAAVAVAVAASTPAVLARPRTRLPSTTNSVVVGLRVVADVGYTIISFLAHLCRISVGKCWVNHDASVCSPCRGVCGL